MKETIIILHGWISSKETFSFSTIKYRNLIGELERNGYAVFVPDLPGFGSARMPDRPLTLSDYAGSVYDYLRRQGNKKVVLLGHSFGGRVALKFSQLHPECTKALIISGTPGYSPVGKCKLLISTIVSKFGSRALNIPLFSAYRESVRDWFYWLVGARDFYRAQGVMRQTFKNIVQEDLVGAMRSVRIPCLLLWGEYDSIVPVGIGQKMHKTIRGSVFQSIRGAEHSAPEIQGRECSKVIHAFLLSL